LHKLPIITPSNLPGAMANINETFGISAEEAAGLRPRFLLLVFAFTFALPSWIASSFESW
jgi:hypothetical protein